MSRNSNRREKRSTRLEDLAQRAGVSISTISRALNDSPVINRRTKQKIWDQWVEKSYHSLGKLSPARFNKIELKENYVGDLY